MATLKGLLNEAQRGSDLVVTAPHTEWMETPEEEQNYSDEAITFIGDVLRRKYKHPRAGRFSPSAMGECHRRVVFGYAGAPQLPPEMDNQEMMDHGSWTHLKWQAEGITLGYMKAAEVWVFDEDLKCGGSMDAVLYDDSGFELKSAGWNIYNRVVLKDCYPKYENLLQDAAYKLLRDFDWTSVTYEDRSSGNFHEFRIPRDAKLEKEVIKRLKTYNAFVQADKLPPMLDECEMRMGQVYKRCPFRKICAKAKSVSEFGQVS